MPVEAFLVWLLIGALSGWIAGFVVEGAGFGLLGDIVIGILGSFVGGYLLPKIGVHVGTGLIPHIINGAIGAVLILLVLVLVRRI